MSYYDIEITYQTGNSFGLHTEETNLELPMTIEEATLNIDRIELHNSILKDFNGYRITPTRRQAILDTLPEYIKEYTFCGVNTLTLSLLVQGNERDVNVFWEGYFETFYSARIIKLI